jgi:ATP-binding cassette subfamily B protein
MQVLSALPGRVRWRIPSLRGRPALADVLPAHLFSYPDVQKVTANPLTGGLLLEFSPHVPRETAEAWVVEALDRSWTDPPPPARLPARRPAPGGPVVSDPVARFAQRLKPHKGLLARMLGASFGNRLLDSAPPIMIGAGIDIVSRGRSSALSKFGIRRPGAQLLALGGLGLLVWMVDALLDYTYRRSAAQLADVVRNDLRGELYEHLQELDVAQLDARDVSEWIGLLEGELGRIHGFIKDGSDPIIGIVANGLAVTTTFLVLSPTFALAQLLLVPPMVVASQSLLGPLKERLVKANNDRDQLNAVMHGNLAALTTVKSFATEDAEAERVRAAGEAHVVSSLEANELSARYVPVLTMIAGTSFMSSLVYAGRLVQRGELSAGAFNIVGNSQLRLLATIGYFGSTLQNWQRTTVSLNRVFSVLDLKPSITSPLFATPISTVSREIRLDDVHFGYEPDRQLFRGLRMRFPAGHTVGLVGMSGAGKSTVLKLLLRLYDVQQGSVRFDGVDIRDLRLDDLRRSIGMVSQDVAVFAGSVAENIAYARPGATREEIVHAAKVAEADGFVSRLPDGYDTKVGFGGHTLSGGERQRLAIARVVLADRPILLFDEATSALDFETEASIQRSLAEITADRTTIIVGHRLSTIRHADNIYVLDDGQVKEEGRHDDLVAQDGIYASMWRVQTGTAYRPRRKGD